MNNIFEDFKQYRDKYGLNQIQSKNGEGITTQNGTLFTMQYLICLRDSGNENIEDEIIRIREVFKSCEYERGLSVRHPKSREIDSFDNQSALLTFSALYDNGRYAKDMLEYGESNRVDSIDFTEKPSETLNFYPIAWILNGFKRPKYNWNVRHPNKFNIRSWWGRSPSLIGLARMAAGEPVGVFYWLGVLAGQFVGAFQSPIMNADSRTLPYIVWQYLKTRGKFWQLAYKLWVYIVLQKWHTSMHQVYLEYYRDGNHPLVKYTKN